MLSVGAVTEAAMDVVPVPLAVAKPAGVVITRLVDPAVSGWKLVDWKFESPLNTTGLVAMVPTPGLELVTATFTVSPVRMLCIALTVSGLGFSWAARRVKPVSGENVVVPKLFVPHTIPEGVRFTTVMPSL